MYSHILFFCLLMSLCFQFVSLPVRADVLAVFADAVSDEQRQEIIFALQKATGESVRTTTALDGDTVPAQSDETAVPSIPSAARRLLQSATGAWRRMDFDDALAQLQEAREICLERAPVFECADLIFDVEFLTGAILLTQGRKSEAEIAFRSAHLMRPERVVDPGRFSPQVMREFGIACARTEGLPTLQVALESKPGGAQFQRNGRDTGNALQLLPGRYVISASLLGYEPAVKTVEADTAGNGPPRIRFDMVKMDENAAWQQVRRLIFRGASGMGEKGAARLFRRFGIQHVIFVEKSEDMLQIYVSVPGSLNRTALPGLSSPGDIEGTAFRAPLLQSLGLPVPEDKTEPQNLPPSPVPDEGSLDEITTDAFVEVRPMEYGARLSDDRRRSIVRSPWLWIATGVAAIIITSAVVTMAAD